MRSSGNSWISCPQPNHQARLRLFCFPYAGGGASTFRSWSNHLPPEIEVCLIHLPGREQRLKELPLSEMSVLSQKLIPVILEYYNIPFAFFGYSMGALIGFELARQLRRQYQVSPVHLIVASRRAPQIPNPSLPIYQLPEPAFIEQLRQYNGMPEFVIENPELMQLIMPVLRADFTICENYVYTDDAPLDCPITAFGGLQDHKVSQEHLAGWREQTSSSFKLQMFPGDHFFLNHCRLALLQAISQTLIPFNLEN